MTVYMIQAGNGGPVKIGWAMDLDNRLRDLQTAHHEVLFLLRTIEGGAPEEAWLHKKFGDRHIRGEWFRFTEAMLHVEIPSELLSAIPIIRRLGGRKATFDRLQAKGFGGGIDAVRMWEARGRISGDGILLLMEVAADEGLATKASDFVASELPEHEVASE